jgi:Domain of unknown function (DUF4263)
MAERFGQNKINYEGILIVGRNHYLTPATKKRLDWRTKYVLINSRNILCYTFDDLFDVLNYKFQFIKNLANYIPPQY